MRARISPSLIKTLNITKIQPTKKSNAGINRAGMINCSGYIGEQKVKIYTVFRDEQVALRQQLDTIAIPGRVRYPKLIGIEGRTIVEQWVDGPMLNAIPIHKRYQYVEPFVNFLFDSKSLPITIQPANYLTSLIRDLRSFEKMKNRTKSTIVVKKQKIVVSHEDEIDKWKAQYKQLPTIPSHLRNGDLHGANIIHCSSDDNLYIIDNDDLSFDNGWFMGWRKTFVYTYDFFDREFNLDQEEKTFYDFIPHDFVAQTHIIRKIRNHLRDECP